MLVHHLNASKLVPEGLKLLLYLFVCHLHLGAHQLKFPEIRDLHLWLYVHEHRVFKGLALLYLRGGIKLGLKEHGNLALPDGIPYAFLNKALQHFGLYLGAIFPFYNAPWHPALSETRYGHALFQAVNCLVYALINLCGRYLNFETFLYWTYIFYGNFHFLHNPENLS